MKKKIWSRTLVTEKGGVSPEPYVSYIGVRPKIDNMF